MDEAVLRQPIDTASRQPAVTLDLMPIFMQPGGEKQANRYEYMPQSSCPKGQGNVCLFSSKWDMDQAPLREEIMRQSAPKCTFCHHLRPHE